MILQGSRNKLFFSVMKRSLDGKDSRTPEAKKLLREMIIKSFLNIPREP